MKITYLDVSGGRQWERFDAHPLAEAASTLSKPDVAFIHLSDFNVSACFDLFNHCFATGRLGDGTADIIFISGDVINDARKRNVLQVLTAHDCERLFFYPRAVPHHASAEELESHFGRFLVQRRDAGYAPAAMFLAGPSEQERAAELSASFRALWQCYVVSKVQSSVISGSFPLLAALPESEFDASYWAPVLIDGKLDPVLVRGADDDIRATVTALRSITDWAQLPDDQRKREERVLVRRLQRDGQT